MRRLYKRGRVVTDVDAANPPSPTAYFLAPSTWVDSFPSHRIQRVVSSAMRAAREDPVGAFEVSKTRRKLQVSTAVIYCLLGAGVVFGYAGT